MSGEPKPGTMVSADDYLALMDKHDRLLRIVQRMNEAIQLYRDASFQSHSDHWDTTRQGGKGCPECIRANKLRDAADKIMDGVEE